jgi:DNA-binding NarL/FixJ family response regulator
MAEIGVVIVEDHPVFVNGLRAVLDTDADVEVLAAVATADEALGAARRERPDVVLMDLGLKEGDGITATRAIHEELPEVAIVVLTMHDDDRSVLAALRAGARGYLLKDSDDERILEAVHAAHRGQAILDGAVATRLDRILGHRHPSDEPGRRPFPELTERELEILDLVAAGLSNPEITSRLVLSPKTVRNHVSTIMTKIGAGSRSQAIVLARDRGLG